jgi:hypothetical protein
LLPAVKEEHQARGRESPRADRPIGKNKPADSTTNARQGCITVARLAGVLRARFSRLAVFVVVIIVPMSLITIRIARVGIAVIRRLIREAARVVAAPVLSTDSARRNRGGGKERKAGNGGSHQQQISHQGHSILLPARGKSCARGSSALARGFIFPHAGSRPLCAKPSLMGAHGIYLWVQPYPRLGR